MILLSGVRRALYVPRVTGQELSLTPFCYAKSVVTSAVEATIFQVRLSNRTRIIRSHMIHAIVILKFFYND